MTLCRIGWTSAPACALLLATFVLATPASPAVAQRLSRSVPGDDYFVARSLYYDGDYRAASRGFANAAKSGVRAGNLRWVDSICYYTMIGESLYQMGDMPGALDNYNSALELYLAHHNWLLRIDFPATLTPDRRTAREPRVRGFGALRGCPGLRPRRERGRARLGGHGPRTPRRR